MRKIIIIIIILLLVIFFYYNYYFKFYRNRYYDESYVKKNKLKYIKPGVYSEHINNPLIQTYYNKSKIPSDVYTNIKEYAPEYTHLILDDNDIKIFLKKYYTDIVYNTFISLKNGAHKADLARYCLLYIYGGLYIDIKTELVKPLKDIFTRNDVFYTVKSIYFGTIYQGLLKAPKNYELFLSLIDYIVSVKNPFTYFDFCRDMYVQLEYNCKNNKLDFGLNTGNRDKFYLFEEKCSSDNSSLCQDGFDQYGKCCFIWDNNIPIIKTRRASYPWK